MKAENHTKTGAATGDTKGDDGNDDGYGDADGDNCASTVTATMMEMEAVVTKKEGSPLRIEIVMMI